MTASDDTDPVDDTPTRRAGNLARGGWGPIPLPAGRKWPPADGFTGEKADTLPSFPDWHAWVEDHPSHTNLAARFPRGVVGVDVDAYGDKPGAATWAALQAAGPLPATAVVSARFGPGHDGTSGIRLYRLHPSVNQSDLWGAHGGVELLRFGHRYAVAPGSTHPGDDTIPAGSVYRCIDMRAKEWVDGLPPVDDLPMLTREQSLLLTRDGAPWAGERGEGRDTSGQKPCRRVAGTLAAYVGTLAAPGASSRYDTARDGVWALVNAEADGHTLGGALDVLRLAYVTAVGDDRRKAGGEPPESEFDRHVRDARTKVGTVDDFWTPFLHCCEPLDGEPVDPGTTTPPDAADAAGGDTEAREVAFRRDVSRRAWDIRAGREARRVVAAEDAGEWVPPVIIDSTDLAAEPDEGDQHRITDLWPLGGNVLLVAGAKTGKTTLAHAIVRSLLTGQPFLGRFAAQPVSGRIVLLDLELSRKNLRKWVGDAGIVHPQVKVVNGRGQGAALALAITDPDIRTRFAAQLRAVGTEVLVIDPLAALLSGAGLDENSNSDVGTFLRAGVDALALEAGVAEVLVIHHAGHGGDRSRGASALLDWPDAIWTYTRGPDISDRDDSLEAMFASAPRFLHVTGRDCDLEETAVDFDPITRSLLVSDNGLTRAEAVRVGQEAKAEAAVVRALTEAGGSLPTMDALEAVFGMAKGLLRPAVKRLVEDGRVETVGVKEGRTTSKCVRLVGFGGSETPRSPAPPRSPDGPPGEPPTTSPPLIQGGDGGASSEEDQIQQGAGGASDNKTCDYPGCNHPRLRGGIRCPDHLGHPLPAEDDE